MSTKVRSRQTRGEMAVWKECIVTLYRNLAGKAKGGRPWEKGNEGQKGSSADRGNVFSGLIIDNNSKIK